MRALLLATATLVLSASSVPAASDPPLWLVQAAKRVAAGLSDGTRPTTISYLGARSRFPRVVLIGSFRCTSCSYPPGANAPTGTVAELRFDGVTHLSRDFALCRSRAQCDATLCPFGRCTRAQDVLDVAFSALDARLRGIPGGPDPFSHRPGTFGCQIHYPVRAMRYVRGSCTTEVRLQGPHAAVVRFVERWRPREFERGGWVRLAPRTHTWEVLETDDGWRARVVSSGDPPPQLPARPGA